MKRKIVREKDRVLCYFNVKENLDKPYGFDRDLILYGAVGKLEAVSDFLSQDWL